MDIEPALSAEEWRWVREGCVLTRTHGAALGPNDCVAAMAQHNYRLPDDDPRKITREMVETLRAVAESEYNGQGTGADLLDIAALLAALLPP